MTVEPIQHFLLVFDHGPGRLVDEIHFGSDGERAVEAYAAKEKEFRDRELVDIVLIGSDSIETVRLTHANYFDGSAKVSSKYLLGI
ncbi:MAG: hypothetical protein ACLPR9_04490 [Acidimicrobiales bacterium]